MWHVSTAWQRLYLPPEELRRLAHAELVGVGDADLGEWIEYGASAVHIRRRLSAEEELIVGPVVDIRGTAESATRLWKVAKVLPRHLREMVLTADRQGLTVMTEPLTLACPICGSRLVLTPAQREDRTFGAWCDGGRRHRLAVMRPVFDIQESRNGA